MKLYLLQNPDHDDRKHDIACGFVIRAKSPKEARKIASQQCGDEGPGTWLDPEMSSCLRIPVESVHSEVILRDFNAG